MRGGEILLQIGLGQGGGAGRRDMHSYMKVEVLQMQMYDDPRKPPIQHLGKLIIIKAFKVSAASGGLWMRLRMSKATGRSALPPEVC